MSTATATATALAAAAPAHRPVTDEERYLFDLQGYVVVPDALDAEQLAGLNALMDARLARDAEPGATRHRFYDVGDGGLLAWGAPYLALIDNPRVAPLLDEFLGEGWRLDHDYADVIRSGHGPIGATLHGGNTPYDECCSYTVREGRIRSGLLAVAFNLRDVGPDDGGFGCVPGSHKSAFPLPRGWHDLDHRAPCVRAVTGRAGTAIVFTEALTHGTLPWRGAQERRTLFYKYSPKSMSWCAQYYDASRFPDLSERQRAALEAPNARYAHRR